MRQHPFDFDDRAFGDLWSRFPFGGMDTPGDGSHLSLERDDGGYVVLADIPGFEKEDVDIRFDDGVLTVVGVHGTDEAGEGGGERDTYHSRRRHVREQVRVPGDVLAEGITATLKNGVLEVHLPLADAESGRRIDIE